MIHGRCENCGMMFNWLAKAIKWATR
jgi:hypothetical protein